jgi:hypothetical protein
VRDFRCVDAANLLRDLHRDRDLNRHSLQHMKSFGSGIFTHSKNIGIFDGINPFKDARVPRRVDWKDYDGHLLHPRTSIWRSHRTEPKTPESVKPIEVIEPLKSLLAKLRVAQGNPIDGPILRGARDGHPASLDNLAARTIKPLLRDAGLLAAWRGVWYAKRRGIGTLVTSVAKDKGHAASGHMRNTLAVAQAHYMKGVPEETHAALQLVEQLFAGEPHRA